MREKSQIKARILQFIDNQKIAKEKFCTQVGIDSSNLRGITLESDPNARIIAKILTEFPELSPDWLLIGKGEMLRSEQKYDTPAEIASLEAKMPPQEEKWKQHINNARCLKECEELLRRKEEYIISLHEKITKMQEDMIEKQQEMLNRFYELLARKK